MGQPGHPRLPISLFSFRFGRGGERYQFMYLFLCFSFKLEIERGGLMRVFPGMFGMCDSLLVFLPSLWFPPPPRRLTMRVPGGSQTGREHLHPLDHLTVLLFTSRDRVSHRACSLPIWLATLASEPWGFSCICLLGSGVQACTSTPGLWHGCWGDQNSVLCVHMASTLLTGPSSQFFSVSFLSFLSFFEVGSH